LSLYDFTGGADGAYPYSGLIFDASGNIYGTTHMEALATSAQYLKSHPRVDTSALAELLERVLHRRV
jgi:hypothetical protein